MKEAPTLELVLKRNPVERLKRDEEPARHPRRAARADRGRLRARGRGGHRPPQVVGPLPRQAEDRHVHAPRQAAGRRRRAGAAARDRRDLERVRPRRRRADDAAERPAPLARAREPARRVRAARRGRAHHRRRAAATPCATSPAARSPASHTTSCSTRRRVLEEAADALLRQPGLLRPAAQAQDHDRGLPDRCNAPEINCIALVGAIHEGRRASACSSAAGSRRCRASPATSACSCRRTRRSRCCARDPRRVARGPHLPRLARQGAAEVHGRRHRARRACASASRRGSAASSTTSRCRRRRRAVGDHLGVHAQKQPGSSYVGVPVHLGLISGDQMIAVADLAERLGARRPASRASRTSSLTNVAERSRRRGRRELARDRLPARRQPACAALGRLHRRAALQLLGDRDEAAPGRRSIAGARASASATTSPACACTSTAARTPAPSTGSATSASRARPCATTRASARQAYDIFLRGGLGARAAIGRPLFRRVPTEELDATVEGSSPGWLDGAHATDETFRVVLRPSTDDELGVAGRARARQGTRTRRRRA